MDNRPIGFFDSGIGGLTSVTHIMKSLPEERIIFYGDTARTPYGSKTPETIKQFTMQIGEFLVKNDVKMIVIACNTVTATCLYDLRKMYPEIPVVGVISPTAKESVKLCDENDNIGIIATNVTIKSKAYEEKIKSLNSNLKLYSKACPAFVPLIEEGIIDNEIMDLTIKYYLDDFIKENEINTLILGCTHYPLIADNLRRIYPNIKLISSSEEVATAVKMDLEKNSMLASRNSSSLKDNVFYASDLSQKFSDMIALILGRDKEELRIEFKNLDM